MKGISTFWPFALNVPSAFCRSQVRQAVQCAVQIAFFQELVDDLALLRTVEAEFASAEAVGLIVRQCIQRNHDILAHFIGCDVVRIGDADVRCGLRRNVRDDIVVDHAVV